MMRNLHFLHRALPRDYPGTTQWLPMDYLRITLGLPQDYHGITPGLPEDYRRITLGLPGITLWDCQGIILGLPWDYSGLLQDFRKLNRSVFHEHLMFFDGDWWHRHHCTCTSWIFRSWEPLTNMKNSCNTMFECCFSIKLYTCRLKFSV